MEMLEKSHSREESMIKESGVCRQNCRYCDRQNQKDTKMYFYARFVRNIWNCKLKFDQDTSYICDDD